MRLDVGCGKKPQGDVNLDLFINYNPHRKHTLGDITAQNTSNFVRADAQHLPFRAGCFEEVFSSHTLEHVVDPFLMLKECLRVAGKTVTIRVPHIFFRPRLKAHKCHFTTSWFKQALNRLGQYNRRIDFASLAHYPHRYMRLITVPRELRVTVYKQEA